MPASLNPQPAKLDLLDSPLLKYWCNYPKCIVALLSRDHHYNATRRIGRQHLRVYVRAAFHPRETDDSKKKSAIEDKGVSWHFSINQVVSPLLAHTEVVQCSNEHAGKTTTMFMMYYTTCCTFLFQINIIQCVWSHSIR